MFARRIVCWVVAALGPLSPSALAVEFQLMSWNVESGGIKRSTIGAQLRDFDDVDLWCLSEIQATNADFFIESAGEDEPGSFVGVIGNTGGADRLLLIYDEDAFEFIEAFELEDLAFGGGRAPLVLHLKASSDGTEFLAVGNHLHRGDADKRLAQAQGLRAWALLQTLPIITMGDFNFDFDVPEGPGNEAFDEFGLGGVYQWERPATLVATQFSDNNGDGENDFNSVLDFVWTAGAAQGWAVEPEIIVSPGDFPDDDKTSDHRPVLANVDTSVVTPLAARATQRRLRFAMPRSSQQAVAAEDSSPTTPETNREAFRGLSTEARGGAPMAAGLMASRESFGRFEGAVLAEWSDDGREMTLRDDFHYVDAAGMKWSAPSGSVINGASIPQAFWSLIGGPFEGKFRNASVVHDVHCDAKERDWRDVHRMFYEACRCGGVGRTKAKMMYYAVYHFGPRWNTGASPNVAAAIAPAARPLSESEYAALRAYVRWRDPSLEELESLPPAALYEEL